MNQVEFGKTGVKVSEMCLGAMMFGQQCDETEAARILDEAVERGVNFLDTAPLYGAGRNEEILGRIIKGKRDRSFIGTKVHELERISESINESLTRLQTDYVDLYMIHWPLKGMRPVKVMSALNRVVKEGKARFVGGCNFPAWLFAHCNSIAECYGFAPLICNQVAYNLVERGIEIEILPQAIAERIAIVAYRPLLSGILAGRYEVGKLPPPDSRAISNARILAWLAQHGDGMERLNRCAARLGVHPAKLAIAWVRHSPAVTSPLVGVSSLEQLRVVLGGFELELDGEDHETLGLMFGSEIHEEGWQRYPGKIYNFPRLRRNLNLLDVS